MTVFIKDTFTGPAGSIAGHVPDTAPAGASWVAQSPALALTGSGGAVGNGGANLGGFAHNYPFDWTGNAYLDLKLIAGAGDTVTALIGNAQSGNFYTLAINCGGPGVNDISFTGGYGGTTSSGTGPKLAAGAAHEVLLVYTYSPFAVDIYLDGVKIIAGASADTYGNSNTIAGLTISGATVVTSWEFGSGTPHLPAPPPWWTRYQRCVEFDS